MFDLSPPGMPKDLGPLIGALDQGTSCTRFLVFVASSGELVTYQDLPIVTICPERSWAEVDPLQLLSTSIDCINLTVNNLKQLDIDPEDIVSIGLTNQRETVVAWSRSTGKPFHNAILWHDSRTSDMVSRFKKKVGRERVEYMTGLPMSTYFSATKILWLMENVPSVRQAIKEEDLLIGTVDTWLMWNLTGGIDGGVYITDVTNASRTQLMNLETLEWDSFLFSFFDISIHPSSLAKIHSSCEIYGKLSMTEIKGTTISACLGDQQAAVVGQNCLRPGQAKCTYGTGCFLLYNVGPRIVHSTHGLISTVAYKMGPNNPPVYALEGSVACAGGAVTWLQKELRLFDKPQDIEIMASKVNDCQDVVFVPAFPGLFAPYWRSDARGLIVGLTQYTSKEVLCRAALEAVCFQTREVLDAMQSDSKYELSSLLVDGAMSQNNLLMQMQAELLGIPVLRPSMLDCTALGAAVLAAQADGIELWENRLEAKHDKAYYVSSLDKFLPGSSAEERDIRFSRWKEGVYRSLGWVKPKETVRKFNSSNQIYASLPAAIFVCSTFLLLKISSFFHNSQ